MGGRSTVCSRGHISWFMVNVDDGFSRRLELNQTPELARTSAIREEKHTNEYLSSLASCP